MKAGLVKALIPDVIGSVIMAFVLVHDRALCGGPRLGAGRGRGFLQLAWLRRRSDTRFGDVRETAVAALSDQQRVSAFGAALDGSGVGGLAITAPKRSRTRT